MVEVITTCNLAGVFSECDEVVYRITEDGNFRITEDENNRITE
jgi:hypothetical protein